MSYRFGNTSRRRLATCHRDLIKVMTRAIASSPVDFTIVCGRRSREDQQKAYDGGFSKVQYPDSRHNSQPSEAVDVCPYDGGKLQWDNDELWDALLSHIAFCAEQEKVPLEFGAYWKSFVDKPHIELKRD